MEVLDHGDHEGRDFFVMRWHESSLEDWMRAAAWPLAAWLKQASARLFAVTGSRIVHHDIKPANILLDDRVAESQLLADLAGSRGLGGVLRSSSVAWAAAKRRPPARKDQEVPMQRPSSAGLDREGPIGPRLGRRGPYSPVRSTPTPASSRFSWWAAAMPARAPLPRAV